MATRRGLLRASGLVLAAAVLLAGAGPAGADEFVGPFPSWADARRDYGALGDGKADDSDALQKALDDLRKEKDAPSKVLYLPAGTYRITRTLQLLRAAHNESSGVSILGEHPDRTVLRWDGPADGVMFLYNPWYARMGRLTFDGAGKALTAVRHGEQFTTANEFADVVFRDVGFGIEAGMKNGIAETAVLRCRFLRCSKAGISIQNFNSLDWWIWHSRFEDCRLGVTNQFGAGHFHVYESLFLRSAEADMSMGNTEYFGIRHNTSVGSKAFFVAGGIGAGANLMFQGNTVLDPQDAAAIRIGNLGPVVLLDNVVRSAASAEKGPVVVLGAQTATVSIGNTFTLADPIRPGDRFHAADDRIVQRDEVQAAMPDLPPPDPAPKRPVIEVAAGADAAAIQKAIDDAAALAGKRPVVHLPAGKYRVDRTLAVPAGCDMQLVGDGILNATSLVWAGQGEGPVLRLAGPCRATLREMQVHGGKEADALVLPDADQPGGRVFLEQVFLSAAEVGLLVDRLARTDVLMHDTGHSGCKVGVKVVGAGPGEAAKDAGRVLLFSGASSNNGLSYDVSRGGCLVARDIWYESGAEPRFMRCTDAGTFTLDGANIAHPHKEGVPGVEVDDFRGRLTFIGATFTDGESPAGAHPGVVVRGDGQGTRLLLLGPHGHGEYLANESPHARVARLLGVQYTEGGGARPIADVGQWDAAFVREMIADTRAARPRPLGPVPAGATDARFFRVVVSGRNGLVLSPGR